MVQFSGDSETHFYYRQSLKYNVIFTTGTGSSLSGSNNDEIEHELVPPASYIIPSLMANVAITLTSGSSENITIPALFTDRINNENYADKSTNFINVSKATQVVRILGLISLISYMVVILFTWIYANLDGYVYFLAGEPKLVIKYTEWVLGFTGITVAVDYLCKEIKK